MHTHIWVIVHMKHAITGLYKLVIKLMVYNYY